jgi:non-heme chloroperoxidase
MSSLATVDLTEWELAEIDRANAVEATPVVFVHGLWLLSSSWQPWREVFEAAGYTTIAPGWPDDPSSRDAANADPSVLAGKTVSQVTQHYLAAIGKLSRRPAIVGHSFGGLIAQQIAAEGSSIATVAIDSAPAKGILPVPISALKSASPVLRNPANYKRAVALTPEQFRFGWTNNLDASESADLYERFHVPAPGAPLFAAATANLNPFGQETKVDFRSPNRGPLLLIAGEDDNTVPLSISNANYKLQKKNPAVTEIAYVPKRGHSLVIDSGWREVAQTALTFIERFAPAS